MSNELKPCPFCGEKIQTKNPDCYDDKQDACACGCIDKDGWVSFEQWQSRPIEDALRAEIARLKHQIANLQQQLYFKNFPAVGVEG